MLSKLSVSGQRSSCPDSIRNAERRPQTWHVCADEDATMKGTSMYKKTIKYEDYNGEEREEDFYFNLTVAEATRLEVNTEGGLDNMISKITRAKDNAEIIRVFEDLVAYSYGEKSPDGRYFSKSPEITAKFKSSPAYDEFFVSLFADPQAASNFVKGIVPSKMAEKFSKIAGQDQLPQ